MSSHIFAALIALMVLGAAIGAAEPKCTTPYCTISERADAIILTGGRLP